MELKVNLIKTLVGPITVEDEVSFTSIYYLIATINHSGSLNRSHYWTFIKDIHSFSWYSCNDKLVFNFEESSPNNTIQYILFYSMFPRIHQKFSWCCKGFCHFRHCLWVWRPTIYPSPVGELSLPAHFPGFTTLQFFLVLEK